MRTTDAFDTPLLDTSAWRIFIRRHTATALGFGMVLIALFAVLALATWSVSDPSLSHSTTAAVSNLMGAPGAIFADLAMQIFGLGTVLTLVPIAIWGWYWIADGGVDRLGSRLSFALLFAIMSCGLFAILPIGGRWPLPIGYGGLVGDAMVTLPRFVLPLPLVPQILVGLIALPLAYVSFVRSTYRPILDRQKTPGDLKIEPRRVHKTAVDGSVDVRPGVAPQTAIDDFDAVEDRPSSWRVGVGYVAHLGYSVWGVLRRIKERRRVYARVNPDLGELNANLRASDQFADQEHGSRPVRPRADLTASIAEPFPEDPDYSTFDEMDSWDEPANAASHARVQTVADGGQEHHAPMPRAAALPTRQAPAATVQNDWDGFEPAPPHEAALPLSEDPTLFEEYENPAAYVADEQPALASPLAPTPPSSARASKTPVQVAKMAQMKRGKRASREAQPSLLTEGGFDLPALHMLADAPRGRKNALSSQALERNAGLLEGVLEDFRVTGEVINVCPGPVVTLYEFEPAPGVKSARVIGLSDDIARSMSAISARVAVIPGRNAIGIELPNSTRETVYLSELLSSQNFEKAKGNLPLALGKTIGGEPVIADLARMPHLLVAGTTGSGKSVSINTMILSILYRWTPEECRLILIDPKMLELSVYDGIPHLLTPVVTDPNKAVVALKWAVREMEDRYRKMSKLGVRNIDGFNARVKEAAAKGEVIARTVQTGFDPETGEAIYEREELSYDALPMLVIVVDEMADLMMVAGKEIEGAIQRLAQMARAAGIHIIMATQRPSVDVITGTIKANFPTRCSFQVTSKIDSRTILGEQGAEQLLGQGDMLFMAGGGRIQRVHGPFVSDEEVESVVAHLKSQGVPEYLHDITEEADDEDEDLAGDPTAKSIAKLSKSDDPYDQAIAIVMRDRKASTSYIQRRLGIGYNRAASLIERMEKEGLIGPANHAGKREVLMDFGENEDVL
ncbi:MAG: DNA translocase FtsK [Pseudomonadota bacterium]